jgi:ribose transport system substrate-binding protein
MTRRTSYRKATLTVAAAAAVAVAAVAGVASASSTKTQAIDFAAIQARIDKASAIPTFRAPGPAFDASKVKGKKIFSIPVSMANPFSANIEVAKQGAAKVLGIDYTTFQNQGQPSQWVQGMSQAITKKVDFIDLSAGTDPRLLGPQIAAATKAGIPVATSHLYDITQTPPKTLAYSVPAVYQEAARLESDWIILDTKGKANVLVITSNEILPTPAIVSAIKSQFAKVCGSACKLTWLNAPVTEWATKITPGVQSALVKDPGINYILPIYDSMSQFVVPAITAAGKTGQVFIATYNGTPFVMDYLAAGQHVKMEVGENLNWLGWAYIDAASRYLAGIAVPKPPKHFNTYTPLRVFTAANIKEAIPAGKKKAELSTGYGDAYIAGYKKLWGVK